MLFRLIYESKLAQAAYLIGCPRSGVAILIDPLRDVDRYLDAAAREGLRIVAVAETHIHADYLSGVRELAERVGAKIYVSAEGGPDWSYRWLDQKVGGGTYDHQLLRHRDRFSIGNIDFEALHTPGHTPEHLAFLVTDRGGGASEPLGIATGDFVFVGDLGRPDLLESAAGEVGASTPAARRLRESAQAFLGLPDYLQVWPAHGAGSACGKALGAVPQSTVGYERRFNPALRIASDEPAFLAQMLADQPEPPLYFARMKRQNRDGPAVLGKLPAPEEWSAERLRAAPAGSVVIVDTRPWNEFRAGHLPGSLFLPLDRSFPTDAGSLLRDDADLVLLVATDKLDEAVRDLIRVGLDRIVGWAPVARIAELAGAAGLRTSREWTPAEARAALAREDYFVLDVRRASEFATGNIPGAINISHTRLASRLDALPRNRPLLVNCRSGARSARACALLEREGFECVNLAGGMLAWEREKSSA